MPDKKASRRAPAPGIIAVLALFLAALVAIGLLGQRVLYNLQQQDAARSDNVQWTLAQTEVEFLSYFLALERAHDLPSADRIEALRREFDIFYSRMGIVSVGRIYSLARGAEGYDDAVQSIRTFLDRQVTMIDSDDATLTAALPAMIIEAQTQRMFARQLANSGLVFFAQGSDADRVDIRSTLTFLAVVTAALIAAVALLAFYFNRLRLRTVRRGQQLKHAHDRMTRILSTSIDGVIVSDADGIVQEFNASAESMFGIVRADAMGRKVGELVVPDHLRDAHEKGMARVKKTADYRVVGAGVVQLEARRANGQVFPVEMSLAKSAEENRILYFSFIRDITGRVAANEELKRARDRALAGEKAKADFLAIMSHEIRTPLNGLLGSLSLLEETRLTKRQSRLLRNMQVSGDLLMAHLNAVLDITKLEAGQLTMNTVPVSLSGLMQDIVDGQSDAASAKDCVLISGWDGLALEWVATDAGILRHALLNLVGNAVKFTDHGRISLTAEVVGHDAEGQALIELRVKDTGIGIADADLERIFQDFETSDASFGRRVGGTGLGLGIARRLIEALGGKLSVTSTVGKGSTFTIRLPLTEVEAPTASHTETAGGTPLGPLDILIVEDNAINREVVTEMLSGVGHRVTTAVNGQLGVSAAAKTRFDVILMDISMPVMDGRAATQAIRAGGVSRDVPIIALSANTAPDAEASFKAVGMNGFVQKPMTRAQLLQAIAKVQSPQAAAAEPQSSTGVEVLDHAQRAELRDGIGTEKFDALQAKMLVELEDFFDGASSQVGAELADAAHKAAGSAAFFGLLGLHTALKSLENTARQDKATEAALTATQDAFTQGRTALNEA